MNRLYPQSCQCMVNKLKCCCIIVDIIAMGIFNIKQSGSEIFFVQSWMCAIRMLL